jgi:hypothetical protein
VPCLSRISFRYVEYFSRVARHPRLPDTHRWVARHPPLGGVARVARHPPFGRVARGCQRVARHPPFGEGEFQSPPITRSLGCQTPTVGCQTPTVWRGCQGLPGLPDTHRLARWNSNRRQSLGVWVSGTPRSLGVWNPLLLGPSPVHHSPFFAGRRNASAVSRGAARPSAIRSSSRSRIAQPTTTIENDARPPMPGRLINANEPTPRKHRMTRRNMGYSPFLAVRRSAAAVASAYFVAAFQILIGLPDTHRFPRVARHPPFPTVWRGCQTPTVGLPDTHRLARVARHPPFGEGEF